MVKRNWSDYWDKQTDARHSSNTDDFHRKLVKEMKFHLGELKGLKVLELGCGDGALTQHLGVDQSGYTGVDFSSSLLEKFQQRMPGFNTIQVDASEYVATCQDKYDVVFSFGVLQYFDEADLKALFQAQFELLNVDGYAVHFGVPVKELKQVFNSGQGTQQQRFKTRAAYKRIVSNYFSNIGHWHKLEKILNISESTGFETNIHGGINYLYRINLAQKK